MTYDHLHGDTKPSNMHILQLDRSISLPKNLRIAYDHAFPLSPSSASLYVHLDNSHRWLKGPTWAGYESDLNNWYIVSIYPHSSIRTTRGSLASNLPPKIVQDIISNTLWGDDDHNQNGSDHWPSELLSYAMVCKAWYHVRDLYWETIGDRHFSYMTSVYNYGTPLICAVQQLESRPELRKYMQGFEEQQWIVPDGFEFSQACGLYRRILVAVGANVLNFTISFTAFRQVSEGGLLVLPQLESVNIRQPERWYDEKSLQKVDGIDSERLQSVLEVQHLLDQHQHLKYLELSDGGEKPSR